MAACFISCVGKLDLPLALFLTHPPLSESVDSLEPCMALARNNESSVRLEVFDIERCTRPMGRIRK